MGRFNDLPLARRYDACDDDGALAAAASRCPQLLQLSLQGFDLAATAGNAAGATLAHLTRLELRDCQIPGSDPALKLASLMPRLEVLECGGDRRRGCGKAAAGHPALRELRLSLQWMDEDDDDDANSPADWCSALSTLPRLSDLRLSVFGELAGEADTVYYWCDPSGVKFAAESLRGCVELTRLDFSALVYPRLHDMLAMVGAAAGRRLEWLRLKFAPLKEGVLADEAREFWALLLHYPCLKHLEVQLDLTVPSDSKSPPEAPAMDEALTAMLRTLEVVLPHCPALDEVVFGVGWSSGKQRQLPRCTAYCGELAAAFPGRRLKLGF